MRLLGLLALLAATLLDLDAVVVQPAKGGAMVYVMDAELAASDGCLAEAGEALVLLPHEERRDYRKAFLPLPSGRWKVLVSCDGYATTSTVVMVP